MRLGRLPKYSLAGESLERFFQLRMILAFIFISAAMSAHAVDNVEAESYPAQMGNAQVSSQFAGYNGSGYVTGLTSEWSYVGFDKSNPQTQAAQLVVRYANGNANAVTHLDLKVGSGVDQALSFPSTGSWTTWGELVIDFTLPVGYQGIRIDARTNSSESVNIDNFELRLGNEVDPGGNEPVSGVSISNCPGSLNVGGSADLSESVAPSNATDKSVSWSSSNTSVATVDSNGLVTAQSTGSAIITVTTNDGGFTSTCNITVSASSVPVTGVSIANCVSNLTQGNTLDLNETVSPANATDKSVSWSSSNTAVATVNSAGVVTAQSAGTATITVTTNDGGHTAICAITVDASNIPVAGVSIANCVNDITEGNTHDLNETVSPSNATDPTVSWSSSNTAVATVNSNGMVTAQSTGSAIITVTTNDGGYTATCNITVSASTPPPPQSGQVFEAESINRGNANVASTESGYSGTGYVKDFTSEWSYVRFEQSYSDVTPAVLNIRYSNGTGQTITNIDLKQGSGIVQNLSFPPTNGWGDWQILTTNPFNIAAGYQGVELDGNANVSESVYIDYLELLDGSSVPPGAFSLSSPSDGASDQSLNLQLSWTASSNVNTYSVLVDNDSDFSSPEFTQSLNQTNCTATGLAYSTTYYWKVTAVNANGSTEGGSRSFTTMDPLPLPGAFAHSSPADGATGVATSTALTWTSSSDAESYSLVVSTNSNLSSPVVNASGISGTSYNVSLADATTYYWQVTATNATGSTSASATSFTTLIPPPPGAFSLTAPADNATDVSRFPAFSWGASSNANSYTLVVSANSNYSNPIINQTGVSGTNYSSGTALDASTTYYWKVTAANSVGSTEGSNNGISFTTGDAVVGFFHVSPGGNDATGDGSAGNPWQTIAHAATQVPAGFGNTIKLSAGTFNETEPVLLPVGVNVEGAGEDQTIINSSGVSLPAGMTGQEGDFRLWPEGSLFQLVSIPYSNGTYYGSPSEMLPAVDGNQSLSGFTIEGNGTLKAGIWVMSRNNVTAHHITIQNTKMNGAIFGKSDMWWYEPMPETAWMKNTTIHDMTFINAAEGQKGNLGLAGLDGAEIYNINIDDNGGGYGIKFKYVGHYKNLSIHDCHIRVSDYDPEWGESISIELWNFAKASNSEIYNVNCNTWLSLVNHTSIPEYEPDGANVDALDMHHITMIDEDGSSGKEAIEAALSGVKIHDCYLQDKGFGIAIWNGQGSLIKKNFEIYNNVITNVDRDPGFGFGSSAAIFIPDPADNLKVYNNVFERMGVALDLGGTSNVEVKNNIFIGSEGEDVKGGSGEASYNLKYHTNPQKASFNSTIGGTNNINGNPGLAETGNRAEFYTFGSYYEPASSSSLVVDAGTDVGFAYSGSAPDIGVIEFNSIPTQTPASFSLTSPSNSASDVSVNPTLTWGSSQYAQTYTVEVSTNSGFSNIVFSQSGVTSTSVVVSTTLNYTSQYYWRVTAVNVVGSTTSNSSYSFTTEDVPPPPGSFNLSSPAGGSTGVSKTPTFTWAASSDASSYILVVSQNSNLSNPLVNQANIGGTSHSPSIVLGDQTTYYWAVTAVNSVGSASASNNGISFTTTSGPIVGDGLVNREKWDGVSGTSILSLTNHANYPDNPSATSTLSSLDAPRNEGSDYGQRLWGYLLPTETGTYNFWIAGDDDAELWLSTDAYQANKQMIAGFVGWTNPEQYDKYSGQASAGISLQAGQEYYFEVLHKEADGGDHLTVAWTTPSNVTRQTISGTVLSSFRHTQLPAPEAFNLSTPANSSSDVSRVPTFNWGVSNLATEYALVVSANADLSSPVVSESNIQNEAYTLTSALNVSTTYYWQVTASNEGGSIVATNGPFSFTTEAQPLPGSFSLLQPSDGVTGTSWNPIFTWTSSFEANSYGIQVSTNSDLSNPVINATGVSGTSYTVTSSLNGNTTYYWTVTAVNSSGSTSASNGTFDFTTGNEDGLVHVSLSGNNGSGDGTASSPYRTVAHAASQVPANQNKTIFIHPGTFNETAEIILPTGVNILGSGEGVTILQAGNLGTGGGKEDYTGSLIQLISESYDGGNAWDPPLPPANGNQSLSGFTIDGSNKSLKAGIWLQNRNNVTMHHITIQHCAQRGAVACFGPKAGQQEPPYYISGLTMHDMIFTNSGADLSDESLGNLCLGHTDGAEIYNITINDIYGYGIKFIFEGYYKNTKVHDCVISVNEDDPLWTEDIAIEFWNLGPGNEVYNVEANTWFSFVNWANTFNNPAAAGDHLKIYDCKIIDNDGTSLKEAIEVACSGTEVYNCYIEDKGWGIAQWLQAERKVSYHHNIFRNTQPQAVWADAGAIFIVADNVPQMEDIEIYNNVFDNLYTGGGSPLKVISVWKGTVDGLDIANNVSTNMLTETYDFFIYGAASVNNGSYRNNLSHDAHNVSGAISMSGNIVGDPQYKATGQRWEGYYEASSASSPMVDAGIDVGFAFQGSAPDIGRWEYSGAGSRVATDQLAIDANDTEVLLYPNPTSSVFSIRAEGQFESADVTIVNHMGQIISQFRLTDGVAKFDLGQVHAGLYMVMISHDEETRVIRVIRK